MTTGWRLTVIFVNWLPWVMVTTIFFHLALGIGGCFQVNFKDELAVFNDYSHRHGQAPLTVAPFIHSLLADDKSRGRKIFR